MKCVVQLGRGPRAVLARESRILLLASSVVVFESHLRCHPAEADPYYSCWVSCLDRPGVSANVSIIVYFSSSEPCCAEYKQLTDSGRPRQGGRQILQVSLDPRGVLSGHDPFCEEHNLIASQRRLTVRTSCSPVYSRMVESPSSSRLFSICSS